MAWGCGGGVAGLTFAALCSTTTSLCFSGEVSERFKEHAWKVCVRQNRTEGSNPSLSAIFTNKAALCGLIREGVELRSGLPLCA